MNIPLGTNVDRNTTLCLACSSSLPPGARSQSGATIFFTACCGQPICPTCLSSNPRLARYNPCLACLGGVAAVSSSKRTIELVVISQQSTNVDGAVRDEDTFLIGDDEDDEVVENHYQVSPPSYSPSTLSSGGPSGSEAAGHISPQEVESKQTPSSTSSKYYIKRGDTLQGIALRFGVEGRELCRLNKLPPSTLTTTPHILHTRVTLLLPVSVQPKVDPAGEFHGIDNDNDRSVRRAQERAGKRLQILTREVDWMVAKAYVALAADADEVALGNGKLKEYELSESRARVMETGQSSLEMLAVNSYLDDEEWESRERREGRGVAIQGFPYFSSKTTEQAQRKQRRTIASRWWQWRS